MDLLDAPGILQSFSSTIFMKMTSMYVCRSCHWECLTCKCLNAKHAVSDSVSEQCLGSDLSTDKPLEILAEGVARNNSWPMRMNTAIDFSYLFLFGKSSRLYDESQLTRYVV